VRTLARISVAPVKGFRLAHPEHATLTPEGIVENRRFFLVDESGARLRSSLTAWPVVVSASYDAEAERLAMTFPDGTDVEASAVATGEELVCVAGGREVTARVVPGPWDEPLSRLARHPVRLVRPDLVGASLTEPVTLVSTESVNRLSREAGWPFDARRFRMTLELAGCAAHEEDTWDGREVRIGAAVLRVGGPIERCAVTTRDPESGRRDLDTLGLIAGYRGRPRGSIDFGVYARVEEPAVVSVGDRVHPI
jgi:uncharacterized protein YcbX